MTVEQFDSLTAWVSQSQDDSQVIIYALGILVFLLSALLIRSWK